jgi:drug/metabolite transporter (DMT)-like permease
MKTSSIPWYLWLAVAFVFGAVGIAGKHRLDASPNPTITVAIFTAVACLLALIFFLKGITRLIKVKTEAKN